VREKGSAYSRDNVHQEMVEVANKDAKNVKYSGATHEHVENWQCPSQSDDTASKSYRVARTGVARPAGGSPTGSPAANAVSQGRHEEKNIHLGTDSCGSTHTEP